LAASKLSTFEGARNNSPTNYT